jgi:hypothetical protein
MPAPAVVSTGVYGATVKTEAAAVEMAATMETVPTMTAMTAAMTAAMTTTTGRCEVWGSRYGTDSNSTGKGDESFS